VILNKKYYKKYFINLIKYLNSINFPFLYYLPSLLKRDFRNDFVYTKKNCNFFSLRNFNNNILISDKKNFLESEVCFISHYVGIINKKNPDYDFYYGKLFQEFEKKNIKFSIILINHTEETLGEVHRKFVKSQINRIFINNKFYIIKDLKILVYIFYKFISFKLFNIRKPKKIKNLSDFYNIGLKDFVSSRNTIKLTDNIKFILNKMKSLKNLIITYEGHVFENIIFKYTNKKKIKSFGYFFSVIREFKNSIFYNIGKLYRPNTILTSGKVISKYLKKNIEFNNEKIFTLGSEKYYNEKFRSRKNFKKAKLKVLVCPEGLYSETISMLELIKENISKKNKVEYLFRMHPVIDEKTIKEKFNNKKIKFSKNKNILKDLNQCDVILYSGSSVSIQAINKGLIPIYYHKDKYLFSIDPVFQINDLKVKNVMDLNKLLNLILKNNKSIYEKKSKIQKYCKDYFTKLDSENLIKELKR